jgi:arylsulfatase A
MLRSLLFALLLTPLAAAKAAEPPNIILILADDLGYGHLGAYGQQKIHTPTLDRLAAQGLVFTQFYAGDSVCAPSRASLLTGQHTGHTPIRGNVDPVLPADATTIADVLKGQGYATAMFGKWGISRPNVAATLPSHHGFDEFVGFLDHVSAQHHFPRTLWQNDGPIRLPPGTYSDDMFTSRALKFIGRARRPFFLYLPYTLPHAAVEVPADSRDGYSFPERPYDDYRFGRQDRPRAAFAAMVSRLDDYVGAIVARLEELGIAKQTLVLFTSDNGPAMDYLVDAAFFNASGGLRGYKDSLYEGAIRVPLIVWWPGTVKPGTASQVAAQWDFLATFAELAGAKIPPTDGISLAPLLTGRPQPEHPYLYWELQDITTAQAVRFDRWKALRDAPDDPLQLYDLAADRGETTDLADAHPDLVAKALGYMSASHRPDPRWPLKEHSLWTELRSLKQEVGDWAREQQAYGGWFGWVADVWDVLS